MTSEYRNPLMEKLNKALEENKKDNSFKNVLKTVPNNTYLVRIIPNEADIKKTFFKHYVHGWNSLTDGKYVSALCPSTYGEQCPICQERFRLWNKGDDESRKLSKNLVRKERYYSNVYVVDDPTNQENNGSVKVLGFGLQIKKIIDEAREGDDADEIGGRMIDFTNEGCNLRIKVEKNSGGFPNYDRSKFVTPSSVPVSLEDVQEQIHDFEPLLRKRTTEEMKEMLDTALYGIDSQEIPSKPTPPRNRNIKESKNVPEDDEIPMEFNENISVDEDIINGLSELTIV